MSAVYRRGLLSAALVFCSWSVMVGSAATVAAAGPPKKLSQKKYDLRRLVPGGRIDELVELIQVVIQPTTWKDVRGSGTIRAEDKYTLDVWQTDEAHSELADLLAALGKLPPLQKQPAANTETQLLHIPVTKNASARQTVAVYYVRGLVERGGNLDFDSLIEQVTTKVAPKTWDLAGGPGSIAPFPDGRALVVLQSKEVHEKLSKMLEGLQQKRTKDR